jgi:hypothetical protein
MHITTRGFVFPVLGNIEAAVYIDHCPDVTGCSTWRLIEGNTTTHAIDLGVIRLRLVLDRLGDGRCPTEGWGLL